MPNCQTVEYQRLAKTTKVEFGNLQTRITTEFGKFGRGTLPKFLAKKMSKILQTRITTEFGKFGRGTLQFGNLQTRITTEFGKFGRDIAGVVAKLRFCN